MVPHNHDLIGIPGGGGHQDITCSGQHSGFLHKRTNAQPRSVPRVGLRPKKLNRPYSFSPKAAVVLGHMETGLFASVCSMQLEEQPCGAAVELMEGWFSRMGGHGCLKDGRYPLSLFLVGVSFPFP